MKQDLTKSSTSNRTLLSLAMVLTMMLTLLSPLTTSPAAAADGCWHGLSHTKTPIYKDPYKRQLSGYTVRLRAYVICRGNTTKLSEPNTIVLSKSQSNFKTATMDANGNAYLSYQIGYARVQVGQSKSVCGSYSALGVVGGELATLWGNGPGHERQRCLTVRG